MIIAKFEFDDEHLSLKVSGHAGQNVYGQDIVCAAASILATTLGQTLKIDETAGRLRSAPRIKLKEGDANIMCRPKREFFGDVLTEFLTVRNGYIVMAHNYPEYVLCDITPKG